jgi:transposase
MSNYNKYEPALKETVLRLHLEEGRTKKSLTEEYQLGQGTITYWLQNRRRECQTNPQVKEQTDAYETNKKLRLELAEKDKEIAFLKKAAAFFAKEID